MASFLKRKQYIIDKQMQLKVLVVIAIYMMVAVLLTGFFMFIPSFIALSGSEITPQQYSAAKEVLVLHKRFWPSVLIVVVLLGGHSIFLFHRLFGPLYRFKSVMREVAEGDLSFNFKLREKDYLKEEEKTLNNMITGLREKIEKLKADNNSLAEIINQTVTELENTDVPPEKIRDKVAEIQHLEQKITQGLDTFKTDKA